MNEYIRREEAVDDGYLSDWYITSVGDESPVWTDEHIEELLNDFIVFPKDIASADVQTAHPLVKVEERVPTVSGNYLCYLSNGEFEVLYFDRGIEDDEYNTEYPFGVWNTYPSDDGGECREWIEVLEVTHWMPLPETPKE